MDTNQGHLLETRRAPFAIRNVNPPAQTMLLDDPTRETLNGVRRQRLTGDFLRRFGLKHPSGAVQSIQVFRSIDMRLREDG